VQISNHLWESLSKTLRVSKGLKGMENEEFKNYLNNTYSEFITDNSEVSRLLKLDINFPKDYESNSNKSKLKKRLSKLGEEFILNIIELEAKLIQDSLEVIPSFGNLEYNFNFKTVDSLMNSAIDSERLVFFNTFIKRKDWHSPLIQMHLCIQKAIEQKINLSLLYSCHSTNGSIQENSYNTNVIGACIKNPPSYLHYRYIFLPITREDFQNNVRERKSFYNNLKFSAHNHCFLSIQIGVITATDLIDIYQGNMDFFENENVLKILKLNFKNEDGSVCVNTLIKSIESQSDKIPNSKIEDGIDFLKIYKQKEFHIWSAFYNSELDGLNYSLNDHELKSKVQSDFTDIIFNYTTKIGRQEDYDFQKFDPLYKLHENKDYLHIQRKFDLLKIISV